MEEYDRRQLKVVECNPDARPEDVIEETTRLGSNLHVTVAAAYSLLGVDVQFHIVQTLQT